MGRRFNYIVVLEGDKIFSRGFASYDDAMRYLAHREDCGEFGHIYKLGDPIYSTADGDF